MNNLLIFLLYNLKWRAYQVSRALYCFLPTSRSHLLTPLYTVFPSDHCSCVCMCVCVSVVGLEQTNPSKCREWLQNEYIGPACEKMQPAWVLLFFPPLYMMFSSGDRRLLRHFSHFTRRLRLLYGSMNSAQTSTHTFSFSGNCISISRKNGKKISVKHCRNNFRPATSK